MKITDISIENLGPYIGVNSFNFDVDDPLKKVVLIGGKNGAGKTTFFNAIRVGLYGCRAYGYESNNPKYLNQVYELINENAKMSKQSKAGVTISILMDDGKDDYIYTFERSWSLNTKNKHETVVVTKNGNVLNETEESDFQSYLLQLIPPDMFKFYFFDGEDIKNFVFNGVRNTDFKNAFLKLCGLDTMELIHENFSRLANSNKKDTDVSGDELRAAAQKAEEVAAGLEDANNLKADIENQLIELEEALAICEANFLERGGITREEYDKLQDEIRKEENIRETSRKWLKETANEILPFIVLKDQIAELKDQIVNEEKAQAASALFDCLNNAAVRAKLYDALGEENVSSPMAVADRVIEVLKDSIETSEEEPILNLSKHDQLSLLAKIQTVQSFDVSKVYDESDIIEKSIDRLKTIRKKLDKSDDSGAENYFEKKDSLLKEKSRLLQKQLETERDIDRLKAEKVVADAEAEKAKKKVESYLKARSVNDVTAKALLAFAELQKRLYKKYIADVEENFKICFNRLINKSDLLEGIKIDDQLQVYPYKNKTFYRADLLKRLANGGDNAFIDQFGSIAYEAFLEDNGDSMEVTIPVEVKQKLSAGERQIFIMALYQALSSLNKVNVPYIIDTPFARIDAEHRQNILDNFFMNLKGQMIVLSTDEEIVGSYKDSIDDSVSNYYLLVHEDDQGTEIFNNAYFEGGKEDDI